LPRDSQGNYSLPAGYQGTPGNTIQVSQHNPPLEDLASAMTDSLPRSGAAPMTGPLKVQPGSASSPSIAPSSNPAIGFWFDSQGVHVAGTLVGARYIGELITWTGSTAPSLCVLPFGQTLLRSSYPDLWTFAQAQIAAGNTFYNNGNGSTTFGIGDLRGRVIAGKDDMGGSAAGRLGAVAGFNADARIIGAPGGAETHTLTAAQIPSITSSQSNSPNVHTTTANVIVGTVFTALLSSGGNPVQLLTGASSSPVGTDGILAAGTITSASTNTSGGAHNNVQPTMICNFALYAGA
jgi:microcystin-dependent protein